MRPQRESIFDERPPHERIPTQAPLFGQDFEEVNDLPEIQYAPQQMRQPRMMQQVTFIS